MHDLQTFLAMGRYGAYVWPAYGVTLLAFAGMLGWTLATLRSRRREEQTLAQLGRSRRERRQP
jgi:heme exporter protein CcmD